MILLNIKPFKRPMSMWKLIIDQTPEEKLKLTSGWTAERLQTDE